MLNLLKLIWRTNPKTLYFNFKYLPFKKAIRLPFWIAGNTCLLQTKGKIIVEGPVYPGRIKIGYGHIDIFDKKKSRTIWAVRGTVIFKGAASIGHGSKLSVGASGQLVLGNNFAITAESTIVAYNQVSFGNDCLLSWDILLMDTDFHAIRNTQQKILNEPAPICIGDDVWIGCRCLILKGSVIPNGSVIAADSLVNKPLTGEKQLFGGKPVTVLKQDISWDKE